jgi:hypothetical protein
LGEARLSERKDEISLEEAKEGVRSAPGQSGLRARQEFWKEKVKEKEEF